MNRKANLTGVLDANAFATLFATTPDEIMQLCGSLLRQYDFRYKVIDDTDVHSTMLSVLKTIDEGRLAVSGRHRENDWESGWQQNLEDFTSSGYEVSALSPKYISKYDIVRLFGHYVRPTDKLFELNFYTVYRHYIFSKYLGPYSNVFEFGSGSGYNLALLNRLFPGKKAVVGLDWSESSVRIADALGERLHAPISGRRFDYFKPDWQLSIPDNSAIMTFNSLEQVGDDFGAFLDFLLWKKPAICINSEPIFEMYDDRCLFDYLAIRYHKARNYLRGYYAALTDLATQGKIGIICSQRVQAGNLFHEAYSLVVWRVVAG
jgi:SAM-dependent methyltransferase